MDGLKLVYGLLFGEFGSPGRLTCSGMLYGGVGNCSGVRMGVVALGGGYMLGWLLFHITDYVWSMDGRIIPLG